MAYIAETGTIFRVSGIPDDQYSAFIMMCCWVLWKRRNAFVFRDEVIPIRTIFLQCKSESANWKARMPKRSKRVAEDWSTVLQMAINSVLCNMSYEICLDALKS